MKAIFVAGTDTCAGKTVVTGLLARYLSGRGCRVVTQKWIQTGCSGFSQDIDKHLRLMGKKRADFAAHLKSMLPYTFKYPSSPHLACRLERRSIRENIIRRAFEKLSKHFDFIIIEGSGGLLVPVGGGSLLIDLVRKMRLPVLLVAVNRIGAVNSALLSIEAMRLRGIRIAGVIFNSVGKNGRALILKDNPAIVKRLSGIGTYRLPYAQDTDVLYRRFAPIAGKIVKNL
ncbi:MAG: dethiobiotin synthase [Candidatus Omnitrophica bacterium]|nr:dethiobiotin synthase [Candidatus Omnitrophota bacterium]